MESHISKPMNTYLCNMNVENHTLNNGIRIIHHHVNSPVAHCGIMINAGSRDESESEQGMAHFIEHALFKGTNKRKPYHILSRLEDVGGELNAYTTKEETWFYASFMKQYYERSIELLSDIIFNSTLPKKELEKEKDVIIDEIYSYLDSPAESIFDDYEELIFKGHPIGRNILGTKKSVKSILPKHAKSFMEKYYNTSDIILSSVGNINFKKLVQFATKHLGSIPENKRTHQRLKLNNYKPTNLTIKKDSLQAHCIVGNRAYAATEEKARSLILLSNLLGGPGMNSRLNLGIREKFGFTYTIESNYTTYNDTGAWNIYFGTEYLTVEKTIHLIHKELKKLRTTPLGSSQLLKAKKQLIGQLAIAQENKCNLMQNIAKSQMTFGVIEPLEETNKKIMALTSKDLLEVANEIFDPNQLSYLIYEPK